MEKDKLIYINKNQFGYHTDAYMHCKYAKFHFDILFICFDESYPKINEKGIKIIYIKNRGKYWNGLFFMFTCFYQIFINNSIIFIQYFPGCSILKKIFFWRKMILDIRSVSISKNESINKAQNKKILTAAERFNCVTVITENVREYLKIPIEKTIILPLGTNILSEVDKDFKSTIEMLYIGTLDNRNIEMTVIGLANFINKYPSISIKYHIVGDGQMVVRENLKKIISQHAVSQHVFLHGRKSHFEIQNFFDLCQIGISFVPITPAYHLQPPTKTLEYLSAGMAVIATNTVENAKMINECNGILIQDNPNSFFDGLEQMLLNKRNTYQSKEIRKFVSEMGWNIVVENHFLKIKTV